MHARRVRRELGAAGLIGGLVAAGLGVELARRNHAVAGVLTIAGGSITAALGAQHLVNPDATTADEARQMIRGRVAIAGSF